MFPKKSIDFLYKTGYNKSIKRALPIDGSPKIVKKVIAELLEWNGGYFFMICTKMSQMPIMTRRSCKTSLVFIKQPPFL